MHYFFSFLLALCALTAPAQSRPDTFPPPPLNNFYFSFFANLSAYSIGYDRLFRLGEQVYLSGELGIGYNAEFNFCIPSPCQNRERFLIIPSRVSLLWGRRRRFFELGAVSAHVTGRTDYPFLHQVVFGYRGIAQRRGGAHFRVVAQVPFPNYEVGDFFPFPVGISIGTKL